MKKLTFLLGIGLLLCALAVAPVRALPIQLDFATGNAGPGGQVSYAGGANPLVGGTNPVDGSSINIGTVTGINTLNPGAHSVTGGILTFQTGNYVSFAIVPVIGGVYTFGSGGSITITGGVPDVPLPNDVPGGTTLLTGSMISGSYAQSFGSISLTAIIGSDTKDPNLLAYFGIPANTPFTFSGTLQGDPTTGGAALPFTSTNQHSTDITNTAVPEPATMLLLGSGLLGIGVYARRRFSKK